ncbi:MAG TPA: DUF2059 domain-containing protein [Burkholderiaceae bacterium]|nr:DUF2059 domain-containing protein [Burkholderiaceae bacterium]
MDHFAGRNGSREKPMKLARLALLSLCLAAMSIANAPAQEVSSEKRAEIERLLEVTGALAIGQQMSNFFVTHLAQAIKKDNPNAPQHVIDAIPQEVNAVITESLPLFKELVIPLYDKHFTLDDLRGLNSFYSTPLGKKTISVMPALMQESMAMGAQWGQAMEPRIAQRLRARFKKDNIKL